MNLSILKFSVALVLGACLTARAGLYSYTGSARDIPDGSLEGISSQITVNGASSSLTDITVHVSVSGGYNGDLYAYLSYNGALVPLFNRVGVGTGSALGYSDSGFNNLTLRSSGSDVHDYLLTPNPHGGALTGTWKADGRVLSPLSTPGSYDADGTLTLNGTFHGMDPNGSWTLFFADVSAGGGQARLDGWALEISSVPEPVNMALGCFGGVFLAVTLLRIGRGRRLLPWRLARKRD